MSRRRKRASPVKRVRQLEETDGAFFLKIVIYMLLGCVWILFDKPLQFGTFQLGSFPVGFFIGLILASRDKFQIDRKIEYVILIFITIISFFYPVGVTL